MAYQAANVGPQTGLSAEPQYGSGRMSSHSFERCGARRAAQLCYAGPSANSVLEICSQARHRARPIAGRGLAKQPRRGGTRGCRRDSDQPAPIGDMGQQYPNGLAQSAPARWATLVSTEITRSSCATTAAESAKSVRSSPKCDDIVAGGEQSATSPSRTSFCRLTHATFGVSRGSNVFQRDGAVAVVAVRRAAAPHQPDAGFGPPAQALSRHASTRDCIGVEIGRRAGYRSGIDPAMPAAG